MTPEGIKEAREMGADVEVYFDGVKLTGRVTDIGTYSIKKGIGTLNLALATVSTTNGDVYSHIKDIHPVRK
jgi:hypothetical protein